MQKFRSHTINQAIIQRNMFNLISVTEGDKVDFWILTDDEFDKSRFARKYIEHVLGANICVSSPEDTILVKLKWAKLSGGSEKQFKDALRIYEVQFENLDQVYLKYWVNKLNLENLWQKLINEAKII